jgi:hypothetical protein
MQAGTMAHIHSMFVPSPQSENPLLKQLPEHIPRNRVQSFRVIFARKHMPVRVHGHFLAQIERAEEAIELVDVAARVAFNTARDAAEFPSDAVFASFVETSVDATGALEADLNQDSPT